jgi:hypothetical protein
MNERVICLNSNAFYALLDEVVTHIGVKFNLPSEHQWVDTEAAMSILNVRSKTTLQTLRDTGKVRFSQTSKKCILYDRASLLQYIERGAKEIF